MKPVVRSRKKVGLDVAARRAGPRTLICIPVYNELKHVEGVLERVGVYGQDVLLVDDGSTDGTGELLDRLVEQGQGKLRVLHHAGNRGYGQSLIDAFAYACREGFEWAITMDCDEQHEPEMIPAFLDLIAEDRWDVISGSRYKTPREDDDRAPQDRAAINGALTRLLNALYPLGLAGGLTDSFCGFKAHRVSATVGLGLSETGYAFPMQLWPAVVKGGLRLTEMSVRRIYVDPKRSFGGTLDQPLIRLRHYLDVLAIEHEKLFGEVLELPDVRQLLAGTGRLPVKSPGAAAVEPGSWTGLGVECPCG